MEKHYGSTGHSGPQKLLGYLELPLALYHLTDVYLKNRRKALVPCAILIRIQIKNK